MAEAEVDLLAEKHETLVQPSSYKSVPIRLRDYLRQERLAPADTKSDIEGWTVFTTSDKCSAQIQDFNLLKGEAHVNFKGLMAMTAAVALAATPAIAAGNSTANALTPAMETVDGSQQADAGNWVLIGLAVVAVGLGIWAAVDNGSDAPDAPVSP